MPPCSRYSTSCGEDAAIAEGADPPLEDDVKSDDVKSD
jgi:hypothetical protein